MLSVLAQESPQACTAKSQPDATDVSITAYHAKYFAYELAKRSSRGGAEKLAKPLATAQVDLNPHQIEAAQFALRSPLSKGVILADEVGLGKTIEAGLVISQRWIEKKRKILVITPAHLRKQWQSELTSKFFLPATILEARGFNGQVATGIDPFDQSDSIVICSFQFAAAKRDHVRRVPWDLAVIDEAHRLRNVYRAGNSTAKAIKEALMGRAKLLLTATPLQNSLLELYGLVTIIDEYVFGDFKTFKSKFGRLPTEAAVKKLKLRLSPICHRTLRRQVAEYVRYTNRYALVQEFYPTEEEQCLYDLVSDYLKRKNLYAFPAHQRQLMTLILRKLLASSTQALLRTLEGLVRRLEKILEGQHVPDLEAETATDFEILAEIKEDLECAEIEGEDRRAPLSPEELRTLKGELEYLQSCHKLAASIAKNSKGEVLLVALKRGFEEAQRKGAQKKAVIFTESVRTQFYLQSILEDSEYRGKFVLFNGSNSDEASRQILSEWLQKYKHTDKVSGSRSADMRAALVDRFRDEAQILIATEAAAEGLNLQFCSLVVNYDMPWNPQRVEQRIGRCHRYGQKCDVIVINFLNKRNAVDQRIYELLDKKFKLFDGVFGSSDEVLGAIGSGVDLEKRITDIYQHCRTAEEVDSDFISLQSELRGQISEKTRRTLNQLLDNFHEDVQSKLRWTAQQNAEYLNKYESWLWLSTRFILRDCARFEAGLEKSRMFLLEKNPFAASEIELGAYTLGGNAEGAHCYRLNHPLAQEVIKACQGISTPKCELQFDCPTGEAADELQPFRGKSGWLQLRMLTIAGLDIEDHLVFCGCSTGGVIMSQGQCRHLFTIPARMRSLGPELDEEHSVVLLGRILESEKDRLLSSLAERDTGFLEQEREKLNLWKEDKCESLMLPVLELKVRLQELRERARAGRTLAAKLQCHRERQELEGKLERALRKCNSDVRDLDKANESRLDAVQSGMQQQITEQALFTVRWRLG